MIDTISEINFYQQLIDLQELSSKIATPWISTIESLNKQKSVLNMDAFTDVWKSYSSLADLYRESLFLDGSITPRCDYEDGVVIKTTAQPNYSATKDITVTVIENTREIDINKENEQFRQFLERQTKSFISTLLWTDFEDGMENEITRLVGDFMGKNRYVTYCWLNQLFNDNRSTPVITSGLLRTLAMVVKREDADIMLSMVVAGLSSQHPEDQEAAIMVVEKWRTKECLDAMNNTIYGSDWVKEYAMQVADELREELGV